MSPVDPDELAALPKAEFAFPGPLRDRLVRAILDGDKVSTTGLVVEHERAEEPLPYVGQRSALVDSTDRPVAVIETTAVRIVSLGEVDLQHAVDEGEDFTSVEDWRRGHEAFWHGANMRAALGEPDFVVDDSTAVVLERFRLVERLD